MNQNIAPDDILDIAELTEKIESAIYDILDGTDKRIGVSAMCGATLNCLLSQCETVSEMRQIKNIFLSLFDQIISRTKMS